MKLPINFKYFKHKLLWFSVAFYSKNNNLHIILHLHFLNFLWYAFIPLWSPGQNFFAFKKIAKNFRPRDHNGYKDYRPSKKISWIFEKFGIWTFDPFQIWQMNSAYSAIKGFDWVLVFRVVSNIQDMSSEGL